MPERWIGHDATDVQRTSTRWPASRVIIAALLATCSVSAPAFSQTQYFDNRPTFSRGAPTNFSPNAGRSADCAPWLSEPVIVEALRKAEYLVSSELNNQVSMAHLLRTRSLADDSLMLSRVRSIAADAIIQPAVFDSKTRGNHEEASARAKLIEGMSRAQVSACLPGIANLLAEAEAKVVRADEVEAARQTQARSPAGRIATVYAGYEAVRACAHARAGRALVYVTPEDVADAKQKAKVVEQRLARENPALDLDALWAEATKPALPVNALMGLSLDLDLAGRVDVEDGEFTPQGKAYCQGARRRIEGAYAAVFADEAKPKKDF